MIRHLHDRRIRILAVISALVVFWFMPADIHGGAGPVKFSLDIPPGSWKTARLRNLPEGTVVSLRVVAEGEMTIGLMDLSSYRRYPRPTKTLFLGRVTDTLTFSVTIPSTGHYFIVADNPSKTVSRSVSVVVYAVPSQDRQQKSAETTLRRFEQELHRIFIFTAFPIRAERCNRLAPFLEASPITVCAEYISMLTAITEDRQAATNALTFSLFHEIGRLLGNQWQIGCSSCTEDADELATVLMIMLQLEDRLRALADYVEGYPDRSMRLIDAMADTRHPIDAQRAKKIRRWLEDDTLVFRWQRQLVPHMQSTLLLRLQKNPTSWTDPAAVQRELVRRNIGEPTEI